MDTTTEYYVTTLSPAAIVIIALLALGLWVVFVIAYIQIIRRAGYSGWWILVMFVPILNIVMLLAFAYREWPIQRELRELRGWADQIHRGSTVAYPPTPYGQGYPPAGSGYPPGGAPGTGYPPPTGAPGDATGRRDG